AVAVGGEAARHPVRLAGSDQPEHRGGADRADHLGDDVGDHMLAGAAPGGQHRGAAAAEHQPESAEELRSDSPRHVHECHSRSGSGTVSADCGGTDKPCFGEFVLFGEPGAAADRSGRRPLTLDASAPMQPETDRPAAHGLPHGPLGPHAAHLCIDMQTVFAERTDWHLPWLERVLPAVLRLARARPERTIFTRFVPPERPEEMPGAWRRYYRRWRQMTLDRLDPTMVELVPEL